MKFETSYFNMSFRQGGTILYDWKIKLNRANYFPKGFALLLTNEKWAELHYTKFNNE